MKALIAAVALSLVPAAALAQKPAAPAAKQELKRVGDPYPLGVCPISGEKLGSMGDPVVRVYQGREIRLCCDGCIHDFEKDLKASFAKVDESIIKDQAPLYPVRTSIVSGKELPEKPVQFVFGNRLIRVVDETERAEFMKEPAKHLAALDKAVIDAQRPTYPLTKCVVSDKKLGDMGEPKDVVVGGRLVRLCCASCKKDVEKNPSAIIAKIDQARKSK